MARREMVRQGRVPILELITTVYLADKKAFAYWQNSLVHNRVFCIAQRDVIRVGWA